MKSDWSLKPVLLASSILIIIISACASPQPSTQGQASVVQPLQAEPRVWRPFSAHSPWNTKLPEAPNIAPDSADMIADFGVSSPYGQHLDVNIRNYSVPLYWADASTPRTVVNCSIGGSGFDGDDGRDASAMVPIPDGAAPDPESDGHLLVVDRSAQREWGLFRAAHNGGRWSCELGADMDLSGDGERPIAETNRTWYTSQGPRACGFPLVAGLIRPEEVRAGRIEHALVVAYPHIRAGLYTPPASTAQTQVAEAIKTRGIPCGGRIQLDPELDLDSLQLSDGARVIARALQEYGAFIGDYSGSVSLYADNSPDSLAAWDELPIADVEQLDLARFRVLELGPVYDDGNGN